MNDCRFPSCMMQLVMISRTPNKHMFLTLLFVKSMNMSATRSYTQSGWPLSSAHQVLSNTVIDASSPTVHSLSYMSKRTRKHPCSFTARTLCARLFSHSFLRADSWSHRLLLSTTSIVFKLSVTLSIGCHDEPSDVTTRSVTMLLRTTP